MRCGVPQEEKARPFVSYDVPARDFGAELAGAGIGVGFFVGGRG